MTFDLELLADPAEDALLPAWLPFLTASLRPASDACGDKWAAGDAAPVKDIFENVFILLTSI